jgi:hypothetical protein
MSNYKSAVSIKLPPDPHNARRGSFFVGIRPHVTFSYLPVLMPTSATLSFLPKVVIHNSAIYLIPSVRQVLPVEQNSRP